MKGLWIVLNVDDVDRSLAFYKLLGLKARRSEMGGMAWGEVPVVEDGGFILWNKNAVGSGQDEAAVRAWVTGELGKGVMLNVGVASAARVWPKVEGKVAVEQALTDDEMSGGKTFTVLDPDGYVVCVMDKWPGEPAKKKASAKRAKGAAKKAKGAAARRPAKRARAKTARRK